MYACLSVYVNACVFECVFIRVRECVCICECLHACIRGPDLFNSLLALIKDRLNTSSNFVYKLLDEKLPHNENPPPFSPEG